MSEIYNKLLWDAQIVEGFMKTKVINICHLTKLLSCDRSS